MKVKKPPAPIGRPRAFDVDKALDRALQVFWRKGYEGTSLPDLTEAMGINRPSLYAAFGNKEALFRKALDRYADGPAAYFREALEAPTARAVVERLLLGAVDLLTDPRHPPGCLVVQGALSCGEAAEPIRQELVSRRKAGEAAIRRRFERAIS
ncbi:MAG: TetR/AcrR family transcriptional regulator, partial [Gammaproteobacteria bacterium]